MKSQFSENLFLEVPIVGILRGYTKSLTLNVIEAFQLAGFTNIEVTMNTPDVEDIITEAVERYGEQLNIGVGTVCTLEDLDKAIAAGAQFIVCPITDLNVIARCKDLGIPVFPGAFSPTEIYQAWTAGARMVKLFPASQFGPKYVKEVLAPLNDVQIMPTGGVNFENIPIYKSIGVTAFGVGSLLFDKELIKNEDWDGLVTHLRKVKKRISEL